jgi:hypothetical protein
MIRTLFWLAVLGVVLYIAYQYGMPQVRAWRYHDAMTQTAKFAGEVSDADVRAELLATARELQVPLSDRRLAVHRDPRGRVQVSASWEEVVTLRAWKLGTWVDTLHYAYEVDEVPRTAKLR